MDEWEAEGAVKEQSLKLLPEAEFAKSLSDANARHAETRRALVSEEARLERARELGDRECEVILGAGIAGISPGKLSDLKCVHAHIADELLSGRNLLGQSFLETLRTERNCDITGSDFCHQHCSHQTDGWRYTPAKNKQKLWTKKNRRKLKRDTERTQHDEKLLRAPSKKDQAGEEGGGEEKKSTIHLSAADGCPEQEQLLEETTTTTRKNTSS